MRIDLHFQIHCVLHGSGASKKIPPKGATASREYYPRRRRKEEKDERHQEREERRRELELVPKARVEDWDQERTDDL